MSEIEAMQGLGSEEQSAIIQEFVRKRTDAELSKRIVISNDDGTEPETVTVRQFLQSWAAMQAPGPSRNFSQRAARLGAVDKYAWDMTPEDVRKNAEVMQTLMDEEEAKGMGGALWRSEFERRQAALPDPAKDLEKFEEGFFQLLDEIPFRGDPDASLFPPGRGVGDNVNHTRMRQEALQDQLLAAVLDGDCDAILELHQKTDQAMFPLDLRDYSLPLDAPTPLQYAIHYKQTPAALLLLRLGAR